MLAEVKRTRNVQAFDFSVVVGFGGDAESAVSEAKATLGRPASEVLGEYSAGWKAYVSRLERVNTRDADQFAMAAMIIAAHEDKTYRGAMIASLTIPWGDQADASKGDVGGYHLVWSRDLYHVATAFMAIGDRDAAIRALEYLFSVQQKPDGSFRAELMAGWPAVLGVAAA